MHAPFNSYTQKLTSREKQPPPESPGEEGVSPRMRPYLSSDEVATLSCQDRADVIHLCQAHARGMLAVVTAQP